MRDGIVNQRDLIIKAWIAPRDTSERVPLCISTWQEVKSNSIAGL